VIRLQVENDYANDPVMFCARLYTYDTFSISVMLRPARRDVPLSGRDIPTTAVADDVL
jgi:hypothetical protein